MKRTLKLLAGVSLALSLTAGAASAQVLFWSTQAKPVEEKMIFKLPRQLT